MIDVIDTEDGFNRLKDEWEILQKNPKMRIFQTYDWCRSAWDYYVSKESGARLWILRWHQEGKNDVVIFPFFIDGHGCLRFIMDTHSDLCDAVYDDKPVNRHWVFKEAAEAIESNNSILSVFLQKMAGASLVLNHLSILLPGSIVNKDNAYSWVTSDKTDSFIAGQVHLRNSDRHRLKAISRRSSGLNLEILTNNLESFPMETIKRLRRGMVGWRRENESFIPDKLIDFIGRIYSLGHCEIPVLRNKDNGEIKALAFRLLKENYIIFWIVLYDNSHLPTELGLKYMEAKSSKNACVFDYGVGAYDYKLGTYRPNIGITFSLRYSRNLFRLLKGLFSANIRLGKDLLKPRLKKK